MDTNLGSLSLIRSLVFCSYGTVLNNLVDLYYPLLHVEAGIHGPGDGLRHIWVLCVRKRVPADGTPSRYYLSREVFD